MGLLLGKGGLQGQTIDLDRRCAFINKMPISSWRCWTAPSVSSKGTDPLPSQARERDDALTSLAGTAGSCPYSGIWTIARPVISPHVMMSFAFRGGPENSGLLQVVEVCDYSVLQRTARTISKSGSHEIPTAVPVRLHRRPRYRHAGTRESLYAVISV